MDELNNSPKLLLNGLCEIKLFTSLIAIRVSLRWVEQIVTAKTGMKVLFHFPRIHALHNVSCPLQQQFNKIGQLIF